jgi:amino acid transporter
MTAIVRTAEAPAKRPDLLRRTVTGTPGEVNATIERVRSLGHLLGETMPTAVHGDPHRVRVLITLSRVPMRPAEPTERTLAQRAVKPLAITGGALAVLAALGFVLYLLTQQTLKAAAAASPVAIGVLVLLAGLLLVGLGKRKGPGCSGLHCGGCDGH